MGSNRPVLLVTPEIRIGTTRRPSVRQRPHTHHHESRDHVISSGTRAVKVTPGKCFGVRVSCASLLLGVEQGNEILMVRRVFVVGLVVAATGIVATGSSVAARTRHGTPASAELVLSAKDTKPLTKAQFITQANALCDAARAASVPVVEQLGGLKATAQQAGGTAVGRAIAAFNDAFAPIVQNQITKTRALKPPKRDQSKVTNILRANQDELTKLEADPLLLGGLNSPFLAADTLARAYGLKGAAGAPPCVEAITTPTTTTPTMPTDNVSLCESAYRPLWTSANIQADLHSVCIAAYQIVNPTGDPNNFAAPTNQDIKLAILSVDSNSGKTLAESNSDLAAFNNG